MPEEPRTVQRWWRRDAQTRLHTYYTPTSDLAGMLLFALIGVLGLVACSVALAHVLRRHALLLPDGVLAGTGLCCVLLAVVLCRRLSRAHG